MRHFVASCLPVVSVIGLQRDVINRADVLTASPPSLYIALRVCRKSGTKENAQILTDSHENSYSKQVKMQTGNLIKTVIAIEIC